MQEATLYFTLEFMNTIHTRTPPHYMLIVDKQTGQIVGIVDQSNQTGSLDTCVPRLSRREAARLCVGVGVGMSLA